MSPLIAALLCSLWTRPALAASFSAERGVYDGPFTLEISPDEADASLLVSVDGSVPTTPLSGPVEISGTTLVRVIERAADGTSSAVQTQSYLFPDDILASAEMNTTVTGDATYSADMDESFRTLPTISLVIPGGVSTTEGQTSFEWIDPDGEDSQFDCGVRKVGGASLGYPKNIMRLSFRGDYGSSRWDFELFGDDLYGDDFSGVPPTDSFDGLTLRSSHDSVFYLAGQAQYTRNMWMDETQLEMGHIAPHGRWAHMMINGVYWGLYHVRERFDAAFLASYLGGSEDDYEAINAGTTVDGSGGAWASAVSASVDYSEATRWINVTNLIDYMILNFYAGNSWDWRPTQNWMSAGPNTADRGGFVFHSSDSDICLVYGWEVDVLSAPGPSYVWQNLITDADPDFMVLLEDRVHRHLEGDGVLTAENTADRLVRLDDQIELAVVAESARWGGGWWTRDSQWDNERNRLLDGFFPYRTDELLRQLRAAGWYPLDAPIFDVDPGLVAAGTALTVSLPPGSPAAELWVSIDGSDPRESGGAVHATAAEGEQILTLDRSTIVQARVLDGETWGPLEQGFFEVDEAPPLILNEWNAVDADKTLRDDGADDALGRIDGNGGDWLELLVLDDHLDIRGWRLQMSDRLGQLSTLTLSDADLLADLRAGTIFTIAEDLPEDPSYDPDIGDWRFHLRAAQDGSGTYVSADAFDVTNREWQLSVLDADGHVRFGPVGEGVSPHDGLSSREVGLLAATPGEDLRRDSADFIAGNHSTYGAPNQWEDGAQDLSALRYPESPDTGTEPVDTGPVDTGPVDTGPTDSHTPDSGHGDSGPGLEPTDKGGCGCGGGSAGGLGAVVLALLALSRRRRGLLAAPLLVGCVGDPVKSTTGDTGNTTDTGISADDSSIHDSGAVTSCYSDLDGDAYGDLDAPANCAGEAVSNAADYDDADRLVNPDAPEVCDDQDNDCDGLIDDADDDVADGLPFYADGDADGYGDGLTTACVFGDGMAVVGGDCDETDPAIHPEAAEICDEIDQDCDGASGDSLGVSADCPALSCLEILEADDAAEDGAYWLILASGETADIWCDMENGGWILGFLRNSAGYTSQGDFGADDLDVEGLAQGPAEASASATPTMSWLDLNLADWDELALGAWRAGSEQYRSAEIPRGDLRLSFGEDGYYLYGEDGYYWCGGDATYTDAGVGAVDNPSGATSDCKSHGSLGSGWDFSNSLSGNAGLTLCGADGSSFLAGSWGGSWTYYGSAGAAQVIWVR